MSRPKTGDRRATALDDLGLVTGSGQWRVLLSHETGTVWALEQHDGQLWQLQAMSADASAAARFLLDPAAPRWHRRGATQRTGG